MKRARPIKPLPSKHHHGNLRPILIKAGLALLDEGGIENLTLRKCAARAGVSHAAPAHHFDGLSGLRAAIAQEALARLSTHIEQTIKTGPQTPKGRLKSYCRGYLDFGLSHTGMLAVIFANQGLRDKDNAASESTSNATLILRDVCAPFVPDGTDARIIEVQVWSLIHGFTLLYVAGEFGTPPPPVDIGPFHEVMSLLDRIGTQPTP